MLRVLYDWLVSSLTISRDLEQLRREVRDMRADMVEFERALTAIRAETLAALAKETAEREKFMLQVQNLLLQWERRLPPPETKPARKTRKRSKRAG